MGFKDMLPKGFVHWNRIVKLNRIYSGATIKSPYVDANSTIKPHVIIEYGCDVGGVQIGEYSYIEPYSFVHFAKIGRYCSIGREVQIGGYQHDYSRLSTNPYLYRNVLEITYHDDNKSDIVIENDVWIGSGAIILKGHIGNGAVIGAGAVVTHDIPDYAIVVGNPAKIIKYRFDKERIKELLQMEWWNWDEDKIKEQKRIFINQGERFYEYSCGGRSGLYRKPSDR